MSSASLEREQTDPSSAGESFEWMIDQASDGAQRSCWMTVTLRRLAGARACSVGPAG
jgi:hypothetical protein